MKFYKWEIFCNLQSIDTEVFDNALEKWDYADKEYNQYVKNNADLIPSTFIKNDLHDFDLKNISFSNSQIRLFFIKIHTTTQTQIKYENCLSFEIKYNQIPENYPKIRAKDFGSVIVQEIEYIDIELYKKNILLDSGVEISISFHFKNN